MNAGLAGALLGGTGVLLGAFGAHGLRPRMNERQQAVFETGVRYQLVHAVALLALGAGAAGDARGASWCFVAGVVVFSGSLYGIALGGPRALGAATPLGGLALLAGWAWLALAALGT